MAVISIDAAPYISDGNVSFVFNHHEDHTRKGVATGADAVQVRCALQDFDGDADAELVDTDTACNPNGRSYGQASSEYTLAMRYSPELYNALRLFQRSQVSFATVNDYTLPISATAREESGLVEFGQLAPEVHYKKNENRLIELTLVVVGGEPTSTDSPAAAVFTHPDGPALP